MFKRVSILFVFISITMMVLHMVMPHHDHGDSIHFGHVGCDNSQGHNKEESQGSCYLFNQYLVVQHNNTKQEHACAHGLECDLHFPPITLFLGDFFSYTTFIKPELPPYLALYTSVDIPSIIDVRGPPRV